MNTTPARAHPVLQQRAPDPDFPTASFRLQRPLSAGTLVRIGQRKLPETVVPAMLNGTAEVGGGPALPARGLCLVYVVYPEGVLDISGPRGLQERGGPWPGPQVLG